MGEFKAQTSDLIKVQKTTNITTAKLVNSLAQKAVKAKKALTKLQTDYGQKDSSKVMQEKLEATLLAVKTAKVKWNNSTKQLSCTSKAATQAIALDRTIATATVLVSKEGLKAAKASEKDASVWTTEAQQKVLAAKRTVQNEPTPCNLGALRLAVRSKALAQEALQRAAERVKKAVVELEVKSELRMKKIQNDECVAIDKEKKAKAKLKEARE